MIVLTDTATTKVKELLAAEDQPELSLRVAVRPGGCSGLSYEMFFDSEQAPDDIEKIYGDGRACGGRPRQRRSTSRAHRSTTRTASRAPGSRSTTRTRSAPAAAASRSPERVCPSRRPTPRGAARCRDVRFTCNGTAVDGRRRSPMSRCCSCCASGSGIVSVKDGARRRANAAVARCSSTASHASRA